jgi:hypothetical protein
MGEPRCEKQVYDAPRYRFMTCARPGKHEEDGRLWCWQHRPSREKRNQEAEKARWKAADLARELEKRIAELRDEVIACAKAVVDGDTMGDLSRAVEALRKAESEVTS